MLISSSETILESILPYQRKRILSNGSLVPLEHTDASSTLSSSKYQVISELLDSPQSIPKPTKIHLNPICFYKSLFFAYLKSTLAFQSQSPFFVKSRVSAIKLHPCTLRHELATFRHAWSILCIGCRCRTEAARKRHIKCKDVPRILPILVG